MFYDPDEGFEEFRVICDVHDFYRLLHRVRVGILVLFLLHVKAKVGVLLASLDVQRGANILSVSDARCEGSSSACFTWF